MLQASLSLDEGLAHVLLQLMNMAVSGTQPKASAPETDSQRDQQDSDTTTRQPSKQDKHGEKQQAGGKGNAEGLSEEVKPQPSPTNEGPIMSLSF